MANTSKKKVKRTKAVATKQGSENSIQAAMGVLDSTFKSKDWRVVDTQDLKKSLPHIPMGSIVIDYLVGGKVNKYGVAPCPGMPRGRIMQLYGYEASGKTSLALTTSASTTASGGTVCFIDYENAIVPHYAAALGVPINDTSKFILAQPTSLDQGMAIAYAMAKAGVDLIVFDSVGAGVPQKILDSKLEDVAELGQVGLLAAMWSKYLPKIRGVAARTGTAVIGISQVRQKINTARPGMPGDTVQGGNGWRFYSDLRLKLTRIKTEKAKVHNPFKNVTEERVVGAVVIGKLDKCRVSDQQGNEETLYIKHGEGFDDYRTIIEIGIAHNLVHKGGAWLEWNSPDGNHHIKVQGMDRFRRSVVEKEGAMQCLYDQVIPYLGATVTPVEVEPESPDEEGYQQDIDELTEMLGEVKDAETPQPVAFEGEDGDA